MPVTLTCANPPCGKLLGVPDSAVGKLIKCPLCGQTQTATIAAAPVVKPVPPPVAVPAPPPLPLASPSLSPSPEIEEPILLPETVTPRQSEEYSNEDRPRRRDDYLDEDQPARPRRVYCPWCDFRIHPEDERCPECERLLNREDVRDKAERLKRIRAKNNALSFAFGLPGIVLGIASNFFADSVLSWSLLAVGYLLIWVGVYFAVLYKRDNPAWALLGLLAIVGLIALACMEDEKGKRLRRLLDWEGGRDRDKRRDEYPEKEDARPSRARNKILSFLFGVPGIVIGIAIVALSAVGVYYAYFYHPIKSSVNEADETAAMTALEKNYQVRIQRDNVIPGHPVIVVHFSNSKEVTDEALKELKRFKKLVRLTLMGTSVTDNGMKELSDLKELRELDLSSTAVGDEGLKELRDLKKLTKISLGHTAITDVGLEHLVHFENLEWLVLAHTGVTEDGMKNLKHLKHISTLDISFTRVRSEGLKDLKELPQLHTLNLSGRATDEGLKELTEFKQLSMLNLSDSTVSAAGLKELKKLETLHCLIIKNTRLTKGEADHLKAVLQHRCEIVR